MTSAESKVAQTQRKAKDSEAKKSESNVRGQNVPPASRRMTGLINSLMCGCWCQRSRRAAGKCDVLEQLALR